MADKETLGVYAQEAQAYAKRFNKTGERPQLEAFLSDLSPGARILDLGCGPANSAAVMSARGFDIEAWDASPEFARVARELHGIDVRVATFDMLNAEGAYDAVFANFSLLHAPKAEMPGNLTRIWKALRPGGKLHIGLKTGTGEKRDALGRFYAYYEEDELRGLFVDAGFEVTYKSTGAGKGLDNVVAPWIVLHGKKNG